MRSCRRKIKTILIILFAVNTLSFYLYHHRRRHSPPEIRRTFAVDRFDFNYSYQHIITKPWPILPSYLPWNVESDAPFRSCEGYFGNGFNRRVGVISASYKANRKTGVSDAGGWFRIDVILGSYKANRRTGVSDAEGWFRCFYSDTLRSSICEGGKVRMHPEKIKMSSGGEKLEMVIGRSEDDELPVFDSGAFDIEVADRAKHGKKLVDNEFLNQYLQPGEISRHTMRNLVDSIQLIGAKDFECTEWIEEPTLLITRFEYANVFHTFTDWYSAYVASRVTGLPYRPNVVFVDGHCVTQLEETWRALFSNVTYAKHFNGPVCFRHAILSPLGYETAWFKGLSEEIDCHGGSAHDLWRNPDIHKTARLSEFGEMIRAAFGFQVHRNRTTKSTSGLNVLFVRREDYLAHPRHGGKVESRLNNEEEVFDAIRNWVSNHLSCKINLVNGLFAHMPMKEQVRAIQDASVIIGAHGAGLTHIVSANPKAVVLEIISSEYRRPHFALIAQWKGLEYHAINLVGSYANPPEVIERFSSILKSLGC